jgi:hypothetical protein
MPGKNIGNRGKVGRKYCDNMKELVLKLRGAVFSSRVAPKPTASVFRTGVYRIDVSEQKIFKARRGRYLS